MRSNMTIDCLIQSCYRHGITHAKENKKEITIARRQDEMIFLFHTDNAPLRKILKVSMGSDFLFLYRDLSAGGPFHFIFVELKGVDVRHAIDQLREMIKAIQREVIDRLDSGILRKISALVVCSSCHPNKISSELKAFKRETKAKIYFKSANRVDLRDLLDGKMKEW
jgi:hypothetical protein